MLSSLFGVGAPAASIDLGIDHDPARKVGPLNYRNKRGDRAYIFGDGEDVSGLGMITLRPGRRLEHKGVRVELIGQIVLLSGKGTTHDFFTISKDLEPSGILTESKQFAWKFNSVDKPHETFWGTHVRLRYFVRMSVLRSGYGGTIAAECDFLVQNPTTLPSTLDKIKMEVGIEECLHIEFEYDKSTYHLKDVVVGNVNFLLARIKIKHMELDIHRTEVVNWEGTGNLTDTETITKFEVMDGTPTKGEIIPVRLYLGGYDLTPTATNVLGKFSVKYHLNLVLVDEEERRYFKKQEVTFVRT